MNRAEQIARHEKELRSLARRLRTAADRIDLAATYAGDGATVTAQAITVEGRKGQRTAASLVLEVARSLNSQKWLG